ALSRELLRPDFIVVSHRHPDHFDVDSLAWLATRDSESVVLTSDEFVAAVCRRLGFGRVQVLGTWDRVELAGGTLTTTPSHGSTLEWGVAVSSPDGVVWNHVDSVIGSPLEAARTLEVLRGAAGQGVDLHLARWCPVLEVSAQLAGRVGFPRGTYWELLQGLAALADEPTCMAPAAVSVAPLAPNDQLASNTFPVTPLQFKRDLGALAPRARVLELNAGDLLSVTTGSVQRLPLGSPLVSPRSAAGLPIFVPFEVAPVSDAWPLTDADSTDAADAQIRGWLEVELGPRLMAMTCSGPSALPLTLCLDVRCLEPELDAEDKPYGSVSRVSQAWTLAFDASGWKLEPGIDPSYDQLVAVSRGGLLRVLSGLSSWGELLLSGQLRCSDRAFRVVDGALERIAWLPALFVYATPAYEESFETATWQRVEAVRRRDPA
ncbi:MAG: MBL fold metallo-hydrolase, partial [Polyangiaceae bacterium]